jgi:hypothetical protein
MASFTRATKRAGSASVSGGRTNDEGPAGSFERSGRKVSPGVEITEAPTGFDNLTNGFDGQGASPLVREPKECVQPPPE